MRGRLVYIQVVSAEFNFARINEICYRYLLSGTCVTTLAENIVPIVYSGANIERLFYFRLFYFRLFYFRLFYFRLLCFVSV